MSFRKAIILIAVVLATLPASLSAVQAAENDQASAIAGDIPTLEQVTVVGTAENMISGSSELTRDVLQALPKKNSSITR